jgi:hypothetical protein
MLSVLIPARQGAKHIRLLSFFYVKTEVEQSSEAMWFLITRLWEKSKKIISHNVMYTLIRNSQHILFVFGKSRVQISARRPATLTCFRCFPQYLHSNSGTVPYITLRPLHLHIYSNLSFTNHRFILHYIV